MWSSCDKGRCVEEYRYNRNKEECLESKGMLLEGTRKKLEKWGDMLFRGSSDIFKIDWQFGSAAISDGI